MLPFSLGVLLFENVLPDMTNDRVFKTSTTPFEKFLQQKRNFLKVAIYYKTKAFDIFTYLKLDCDIINLLMLSNLIGRWQLLNSKLFSSTVVLL